MVHLPDGLWGHWGGIKLDHTEPCEISCSVLEEVDMIHRAHFFFEQVFYFLPAENWFLRGKGKSMWPFSAQRWQISAPRLLALCEMYNWGRKVESGMLWETVTLIYPDPFLSISFLAAIIRNVSNIFQFLHMPLGVWANHEFEETFCRVVFFFKLGGYNKLTHNCFVTDINT